MPPSAVDVMPQHVNRIFRGRASEPHYTVSELTTAHPRYAGIKEQFAAGWEHPTARPTVLRILQVRNGAAEFERYNAYLGSLGQAANEVRRFHGTSCAPACRFGVAPDVGPCDANTCAVCNICARSFSLELSGKGPGGNRLALRYGGGMYFSKASSKSNDYAAESERGGVRVMFLCRVATGRVLEVAQDTLDQSVIDRQLAARGKGGAYDSIVGLAKAKGGALNFEENVVYRVDAALPSYVIVYRLK